jgi:hypothetical protein
MPRGKDTKSLFLVYNLLTTELQKVFYLPLFYCKDWSQLHYLMDMNLFTFDYENVQYFIKVNYFLFFSGFLTLPTAYVTGNPVECVVHPDLWNKTDIWDPLGVGKTNVFEDQYEEEYIGYPIETVRL